LEVGKMVRRREEYNDEEYEEELITRALRPGLRMGLERLIATYLATALYSPPLEKIRAILECYQLLTDEMKKDIGVDEKEDTLYRRLYTCAISLQNTLRYIDSNEPTCKVSWSFMSSDAWKYFFWIDWMWEQRIHYAIAEKMANKIYDSIKNEEDILVGKIDKEKLAFYIMIYRWSSLSGMYENTYYILRNRFIEYSMPIISDLMRRIFTHLIDPEIWNLTLSMLGGGHGKGSQAVKDKDVLDKGP
jgi:hypothetical protein